MTDLGKPISVHKMVYGRNVMAVLVSATMSVGMWWARSAMRPTRPGLVLLIAIGFTLITIALASSLWLDRSRRIIVHERGVAWNHWGKEHRVAFDEIAAVRELEINGRSVALLLERHAGDEVRLRSSVTDRDALLAALAMNISPKIPAARVVSRS
jgi:hypothetical protein